MAPASSARLPLELRTLKYRTRCHPHHHLCSATGDEKLHRVSLKVRFICYWFCLEVFFCLFTSSEGTLRFSFYSYSLFSEYAVLHTAIKTSQVSSCKRAANMSICYKTRRNVGGHLNCDVDVTHPVNMWWTLWCSWPHDDDEPRYDQTAGKPKNWRSRRSKHVCCCCSFLELPLDVSTESNFTGCAFKSSANQLLCDLLSMRLR